VDERVAEEQCQRLGSVRAGRDGQRVQAALARLAEAAAGTENLVPRLLEAVRAYATIGEICDALRAVFGVHQQTVVL
jgi:methylmalonyl-CoA mutase N-terminal domain/subunit